ncbi:hypothetical protein GQ53DRAFT_640012 [Thozetella sp. PMI_491]|nr:hypothetical protein GQ53DRAFT_640012 [Thozetella sp. PMI_491]
MAVLTSLAPPKTRVSDPFIISTGPESIKPDAKARRLIRGHVMKGRNRRKGTSLPAPIGSWVNGDHDPEYHAQLDGARSLALLRGPEPSTLPGQVTGSDIYAMPGAADLEPYMVELITNFESATRTPASIVARCTELAPMESPFHLLLRDVSYLHSFLYLAQSYFDLITPQKFNHRAILHMTKAINVLRANLADPEMTPSLYTFFGVLSLGLVAEARGDFKEAKKHLNGLYHLVECQGGISSLSGMRQLQLKCCRLDVGLALKTGSKPLFFADTSWKTYLPSRTGRQTMEALPKLGKVPDARLVNVWADMREFAVSISLAMQADRKLEGEVVFEALMSILYRLQHLEYDRQDEHETLRLMMLAFATTIFFEGHGLESKYTFLASRVREVLQLREYGTSAQDAREHRYNLWLLAVARVSILDGPEDHGWLVDRQVAVKQALELSTWFKAKEVLRSFLWVDMVHDERGREFFNAKLDSIGTGIL